MRMPDDVESILGSCVFWGPGRKDFWVDGSFILVVPVVPETKSLRDILGKAREPMAWYTRAATGQLVKIQWRLPMSDFGDLWSLAKTLAKRP